MKISTLFICSNCDAQSQKWSGRCLDCGQWGTLHEESKGAVEQKKQQSTLSADAVPLSTIEMHRVPRIQTGMEEFDQVLGGGIVPGSFILLGGEPGCGKSTLMLQISLALLSSTDRPILYASGEESGQQVKMRYERLSLSFPRTRKSTELDPRLHRNDNLSSILFIGETDIDKICGSIRKEKPLLAIVDSIQTVHTNDIQNEAGSITQVRACTVKLLETAKQTGSAVIITGHVTKEGTVAGPKTLEHLVDTVLYLEGDQSHYYRLLKTAKNRFGSTNELGVFEMSDSGLCEVKNPSQAFISPEGINVAGTATTVVLEGTRAFLVQVQALCSKTYFGYPQRRAVGFDANRMQLLIAVLTKRYGLNLGDQDIHLNVVGGFKISETAVDLAVCASIISAYQNKVIPQKTIIMGEVGLSGEIRPVYLLEKRLKEAEKLGFTHASIPKPVKPIPSKMEVHYIKHIKELEL